MTITQALIIPTDDLHPEDIAAISEFAEARLASRSDSDQTVLGWTRDSATRFALRMAGDARGLVRLKTLLHAANNGSYVDRETVYELGGFSGERSLKGFTKPIRRHMAGMQQEGLLPHNAVLPLAPVYDPNNASFQRTTGFQMPAGLAKVFSSIVGA